MVPMSIAPTAESGGNGPLDGARCVAGRGVGADASQWAALRKGRDTRTQLHIPGGSATM